MRLDFLGQIGDEESSAYIPANYISDARQRIEVYRKVAELMDLAAFAPLRAELRDRFGKLPAPVELLLQVAEVKVLAANTGIDSVETKEDKLMLTRNKDFITAEGKFPRLKGKSARARLKEIQRLLRSLAKE